MSRYIDINQLLGEIGTSDRSAGDPWTLSRSNRGTVKGSAFSPTVVGDLGAPSQDLYAGIQSSESITQADAVASRAPSPSGTGSGADSTSSGSGFWGSLLNFFPLTSTIAKLFGLGDDEAQTAAPTPYQLPPSVNFEGALSSVSPGITSLSDGSDGLPRTTQSLMSTPQAVSASNFTDSPAEMLAKSTGPFISQSTPTGALGQLSYLGLTDNTDSTSGAPDASTLAKGVSGGAQDMVRQLSMLGTSAFAAEPGSGNPVLSSDLVAPPTLNRGSDTLSSSNLPGTSASGVNDATNNDARTQSGHSILVQVQAMDSQSFMDHSQDIAQAVRQAMLNMNSLNDVVQDL